MEHPQKFFEEFSAYALVKLTSLSASESFLTFLFFNPHTKQLSIVFAISNNKNDIFKQQWTLFVNIKDKVMWQNRNICIKPSLNLCNVTKQAHTSENVWYLIENHYFETTDNVHTPYTQ